MLLVLLTLALLASACYPHNGRGYHPGPEELIAHAKRACLRQDRMAARTLLERIQDRHPDSQQALETRPWLKREDVCAAVKDRSLRE